MSQNTRRLTKVAILSNEVHLPSVYSMYIVIAGPIVLRSASGCRTNSHFDTKKSPWLGGSLLKLDRLHQPITFIYFSKCFSIYIQTPSSVQYDMRHALEQLQQRWEMFNCTKTGDHTHELKYLCSSPMIVE